MATRQQPAAGQYLRDSNSPCWSRGLTSFFMTGMFLVSTNTSFCVICNSDHTGLPSSGVKTCTPGESCRKVLLHLKGGARDVMCEKIKQYFSVNFEVYQILAVLWGNEMKPTISKDTVFSSFQRIHRVPTMSHGL